MYSLHSRLCLRGVVNVLADLLSILFCSNVLPAISPQATTTTADDNNDGDDGSPSKLFLDDCLDSIDHFYTFLSPSSLLLSVLISLSHSLSLSL